MRCNWGHHPSYGGPKWGEVADCLRSYVTGQTSAEALLDTAFTLAHNNGPVFNKGYIYKHHTNRLIQILDIQAKGQIPQWVGASDFDVIDDTVRADWQLCADLLPEFNEEPEVKPTKKMGVEMGTSKGSMSSGPKKNHEGNFVVDPNTKVKVLEEEDLKKLDTDVAAGALKTMKAVENIAAKKATETNILGAKNVTFKVSPTGKIKFKAKPKG